MIKHYDIEIFSAEDFVLPFTLRDDNHQPIDLTGATVEASLAEYPGGEGIPFAVTHNSSGGHVTMILPHEVTDQISFSAGYYDVFVTYPDETREQVLNGSVKIYSAVTRFPNDGTVVFMITLQDESLLPDPGDLSRLYYCTETGIIYRWNGTGYVSVMRNSSVTIGETTTLPAGSDATVTNTGTVADLILNFGIPAGVDGDDGFSPSASVSKSGNKTTITVTDKDGTTTAEVLDGEGSGDVMGPNSATDSQIAVFDGATGKAIKDSGFTIGTSVPANAVFTDTTYTETTDSVGSATAGTDIDADDITAWDAGTLPTATVDDQEVLTLTFGSLPSLSYSAKTIPNISVSSKTVVTAITAS